LHWKAPEFAAAITGGMASGAGSIVGTATTHHSGGKNWNKKIIHGCFQPAKKYTFIKNTNCHKHRGKTQ
jgi:hypothetical protein